VRFWDTSAILPLVVAEPMSPAVAALARSDEVLVVWWGTRLECTSAVCRRQREGSLSAVDEAHARTILRALASTWTEVLPTERLRTIAERLLSVHALRASDALQLASALESRGASPGGGSFVCLDDRLRDAARREGFVPEPA
jgi:predicted nucleic acid-binding protein